MAQSPANINQSFLGKSIAIIGYGYTAKFIGEIALSLGMNVVGLGRSQPQPYPDHDNFTFLPFDAQNPDDAPLLEKALDNCEYAISTIAPIDGQDPLCTHFYESFANRLSQQDKPFWFSYLSSTSVYGDTGGAWVNETTLVPPRTQTGIARLNAEGQWQTLFLSAPLKMQHRLVICRLSGIYGPQRNALMQLKTGRARRIIKAGQYFSRIHVYDIAKGVMALMTACPAGEMASPEVINFADNEPAAPWEVIEYAAQLLNIDPPPVEDWHNATLSDMQRQFYASNKRVANKKLRGLIGNLRYGDYRLGLLDLLDTL